MGADLVPFLKVGVMFGCFQVGLALMMLEQSV